MWWKKNRGKALDPDGVAKLEAVLTGLQALLATTFDSDHPLFPHAVALSNRCEPLLNELLAVAALPRNQVGATAKRFAGVTLKVRTIFADAKSLQREMLRSSR